MIAGFVSADFHNEHLSSIASSCVGFEEYRGRLPGFLSDFADRRYELLNIVEEDRGESAEVVVRYDFSFVYEGAPVVVPGVMWFTVVDEQITHRIDVWDSGVFFAQTAPKE